MTQNTNDFVFDLAAEDYWTPTGCAEWPAEKQPRIWYRIPTGPEAQQFSISQGQLREEHGLASDDVNGFWALPEALDLYLAAAEKYTVRIERFQSAGVELQWNAAVLADHGLDKRGFLMRLGPTGQQRFFALFALVGCMMTGLRSSTKKNFESTFGSVSDSKKTDAVALSAAAPTIESPS